MKIEINDLSMAQSPLMLVDDTPENLELLGYILEGVGMHNYRGFTDARKALDALESIQPHLIILDLKMPGVDGFEFLDRVRNSSVLGTYTPILVYTADLTSEAKIRALDLGAADFLTKPGDAIEIQLRVRNFLRTRKLHSELSRYNELLEAEVRRRTEHLAVARRETVELLAGACEYRDDDTGRHTQRVGELSASLAKELSLDPEFAESLRIVAPLHDVGKIAIPDSILHKPGKLTYEEYDFMKLHVKVGADLLAEKTSPLLQLATDIARYHHERWDGKGYEAGLAGEDIPLCARIVCVADAFDALTNDRPYRKGRPQNEAFAEIQASSGTQFDPNIVDALQRHLGISHRNNSSAS